MQNAALAAAAAAAALAGLLDIRDDLTFA